jgi:hypothetical protein
MLRSSTSRINSIVGKIENAILDLDDATLAAESDIAKDDERIAKITKERDDKAGVMKKGTTLRNNLAKLFEE